MPGPGAGEYGEKVTVGVLAGEERLRPLPGTPYPAVIEDSRQISPQALVSWKGNLYSVPPGRPASRSWCVTNSAPPPSTS